MIVKRSIHKKAEISPKEMTDEISKAITSGQLSPDVPPLPEPVAETIGEPLTPTKEAPLPLTEEEKEVPKILLGDDDKGEFTLAKAKAKLKYIKDTMIEKYAGVKYHNPFTYYAKHFRHLEDALKTSSTQAQAIVDIKDIKDIHPVPLTDMDQTPSKIKSDMGANPLYKK